MMASLMSKVITSTKANAPINITAKLSLLMLGRSASGGRAIGGISQK